MNFDNDCCEFYFINIFISTLSKGRMDKNYTRAYNTYETLFF